MGKKMDVEDIIDTVLNGPNSTSYKTIIDVVHTHDSPISFHELHEKLINHELLLLQQSPPTPNLHQPVTTFAANKRHPNNQWNNRTQANSTTILPTPTGTPQQFLGKCQFCFTKSHLLTSCCDFKNRYPQVTLPPLPKMNNNPRAHVMTTTQPDNNPHWLFDSDASHHITNDLNALSLHAPYDGTDELVIGDVSSLTITHIGSIILCFSNIFFLF